MYNSVYEFIELCCRNIKISPQLVIDNLLSIEDEKDILSGVYVVQEVDWLIDLWVKNGCKRVTDKSPEKVNQKKQAIDNIRQILSKK